MKRLLAVVAMFEAFSLSVLMLNGWFVASLHGGTVTVSVDAFGEMWVEYVLWLVLTPVLVLGFHYALEEVSGE